MKPIVSVIIPTYNRCVLLKRAIRSVLNQTYKNYELVIVDNHSSDNTQEYCGTLQIEYKQIRYIRNNKNLGMIGNWNKGLRLAKGRYVSLLMDDDYWHKKFLKETVRVLATKKNVGFVNVWVERSSNPYSNIYKLYKKNTSVPGYKCLIEFLKNKWLVGLPSSILFRKNITPEFTNKGLDIGFWISLCNLHDFYYIDKKLCYWSEKLIDNFTNSQYFGDYLDKRQFCINLAVNYLRKHRKKILSKDAVDVYNKYALDYLNQEVFAFKSSKRNLFRMLPLKYELLYIRSLFYKLKRRLSIF